MHKYIIVLILLMLGSCGSPLQRMSPDEIVLAYLDSENIGYSEEGLQYLSLRKQEQRQDIIGKPYSQPIINVLGQARFDKEITNVRIEGSKAYVDISIKTSIITLTTTFELIREKGWKIDNLGLFDI